MSLALDSGMENAPQSVKLSAAKVGRSQGPSSAMASLPWTSCGMFVDWHWVMISLLASPSFSSSSQKFTAAAIPGAVRSLTFRPCW